MGADYTEGAPKMKPILRSFGGERLCGRGTTRFRARRDSNRTGWPALGAGGNIKVNGQVLQEGFDVGHTLVFRLLPSVVKYVTLNPVNVGLLGAEGIMLQPNRIADLLEELSRLLVGFHFVASDEIANAAATVWVFESYSKSGGNLAHEIGSIFAT